MKARINDEIYQKMVDAAQEACHKIGFNIPVSYWRLEVSGEKPVIFISQSFTNNARRVMCATTLRTNHADYGSINLLQRSIDNILRTPPDPHVQDQVLASGIAGQTNRGIIIGSGTALENPERAAIQTIIPHGTAVGQVEYQAHHLFTVALNTVAGRIEVTQARRFINNSGSPIAVNEVCLYEWYGHTDRGLSGVFMTIRDLLPSTVNIPHTGQLTATLLKTIPSW